MDTVHVSAGDRRLVAYFSMEIGIDERMPTYSGGLGVLAGDTVRAAADARLPMVAITLMHRKGYFRQHLDSRGNQTDTPYDWSPEQLLEQMEARTSVVIEGRQVRLRAWRYTAQGVDGYVVPIYFLDADLAENDPADRRLTDHLYGGDSRYRLCQETILGLGGVSMLEALGYWGVQTFHMNEGHSALLTLALLEREAAESGVRFAGHAEVERVRRRCVFTTHTPVPAGHDRFPAGLVRQVIGRERTEHLARVGVMEGEHLNMTTLALRLSRYVNSVSMTHERVSRGMFPGYQVESITNGVHAPTWTSPPFSQLYDQYIPDWRRDNTKLRGVSQISVEEITQAHAAAKKALLAEVRRRTGTELDSLAFTIGFARRATPYKRAALFFSDIERLRRIARDVGPMQVVYGGKAHPRDEGGKAQIRRIFEAAEALKQDIKIVYMEEYDIGLAKYITSGVDLWLNTPERPHEASGTSGMKAALNGVPSLSTLDGWWVEGHQEGVTGWAIEDGWQGDGTSPREAESLYSKLEKVILPMFYERPGDYAQVMRSAIEHNGSFFNAQRMLAQYIDEAYHLSAQASARPM